MADYIDRKALKRLYYEKAVLVSNPKSRVWASAINLLELQPTADVAPVRHGKWKERTISAYRGMDDFGDPIYRDVSIYCCSNCDRETVVKERYCPNCGAKMILGG